MIIVSRRYILCLAGGLLTGGYARCQADFSPPLKFPLSLSADFGELRADHYHSGIDLRTQGVTGKEVLAADDGYVYLILVSPTGFGKAIFIRHPSGFSTVYGHLESYAPDIEEYVKAQQYRNKSFSIMISPPPGRFLIKKGQLLGFSGNTGSSSGPHLHFEVRRSDMEKPVNPEKFNFPIEDNIRPVIERLVVYPSGKNCHINGRTDKLFLSLSGENGNYELQQQLVIHGLAGFGITSYDYMNDTPNRFGISSIDLIIDSIPWFSYEVNEFSFYETRYINAHIDYEELLKRNIDIERLFVLPNDRLSLYKTYMNNGLFDFGDGKVHKVTITVKDGKKNQAKLSFVVYPGLELKDIYSPPRDSSLIVMPYGKENFFESRGVRLKIPSGALYDTLWFRYRRTSGNNHFFSPVHHLHDRYTPLQKQVSISIKPDSIPPGKSSKLLLVQIDDKGMITSAGGIFADGYVTANVYNLGNYSVGIDTVPPSINDNGAGSITDLSGKSEIKIRIRDDFSGIKSYEGFIDGKWALFEYDEKNDVVFYKFDPERITKGTKHSITLRVSDNCDNSTTWTREFIW